MTGDREEQYRMLQGSGHQEDLAISNVYVPNNKAASHLRQNLRELKPKIANPRLSLETSTPTPLTALEQTTRQKNAKKMEEQQHH